MNKGGIHDYKILAFAGSARQDSVNKTGENCLKELKGADATYLDFRDLYRSMMDLEAEGCQRMPSSSGPDESASGIHSCPEYNSSITPLLKMRSIGHRVLNPVNPLVCFKEKIAVLMSASPGNLGGLRGLSCPFHSWQHWGSGVARMVIGNAYQRLMRMAIER